MLLVTSSPLKKEWGLTDKLMSKEKSFKRWKATRREPLNFGLQNREKISACNLPPLPVIMFHFPERSTQEFCITNKASYIPTEPRKGKCWKQQTAEVAPQKRRKSKTAKVKCWKFFKSYGNVVLTRKDSFWWLSCNMPDWRPKSAKRVWNWRFRLKLLVPMGSTLHHLSTSKSPSFSIKCFPP